MQLVASPALYPGACAISGSSDGPFIDTETEAQFAGRLYVAVRRVEEMAAAAGLPSRELAEELTRAREDAEARAEALAAQLEAATERVQALEELREAVGYTLEQGAVTGPTGELRLRVKPGAKRSGVDRLVAEGRAHRSMLQTFDEAIEALREARGVLDEATAPFQHPSAT